MRSALGLGPSEEGLGIGLDREGFGETGSRDELTRWGNQTSI